MKVTFYTLGCKVNQYETEAMREAFAAAGHTPVPNSAPFDAAVINSCTVTAESDRKTRQLLHKVRRENPEAIIILTGFRRFPKRQKRSPTRILSAAIPMLKNRSNTPSVF